MSCSGINVCIYTYIVDTYTWYSDHLRTTLRYCGGHELCMIHFELPQSTFNMIFFCDICQKPPWWVSMPGNRRRACDTNCWVRLKHDEDLSLNKQLSTSKSSSHATALRESCCKVLIPSNSYWGSLGLMELTANSHVLRGISSQNYECINCVVAGLIFADGFSQLSGDPSPGTSSGTWWAPSSSSTPLDL